MQASHVGREAELTALGQSWRLARWERRTWDAFLDWARPRLPDPLEVARKALALFPQHLHEGIVRHAIDLSSRALASNSPQVQALLASAEGTAHVLWLLLRDNHPGVTEEQAWLVMAGAGDDALAAAFRRCQGRTPEAAAPNPPAPAGA